MKNVSVVLQGWTLRTTEGTTDTGNDFTVTGSIEYPVGTIIATIPETVVTSGANVEGAEFELPTEIPTNGTWRINLASTVPNGQKYIVNLGFAGVRVHTANRAALKKLALYAVGDSIMTNNNGAAYNAANTRCPCYQASISGARASFYGANSAQFFQRQADLAGKLGITHFLSNFGTNDFGALSTVADIQGYLLNMKAAASAKGVKFAQATMCPRTSKLAAVTPTSVTSSGNNIICAVADPALFVVGKPYTIAGATQTEYNGSKICVAKDATTVTFLFQGSGTSPATGTITINPWKDTSSAEWMTAWSGNSAAFQPGGDSPRGLFNAWVRSGAVDDYVEWADACEPSRDSGRWLVAGENANLPDVQLITVSSVISTSRFNSNYSRGTSTIPNGFLQAITGNNAGHVRSGNGNTNGDVTASSAWTNTQTIGDTLYAIPGVSYMSDDGTHPRVSGGGKGGQTLLDNATAAWIDAKLA
ncbi:hypothetical protein [Sinorhizobium sp. BJ1]|uniref:hypothetical protein n=1 Tax=Sinorhizobium sp. BJ1 TaxID=2035455 RepID=UPI00118542BF|nr:hypothetical protein [Sinorhizobium sp. BJ1]